MEKKYYEVVSVQDEMPEDTSRCFVLVKNDVGVVSNKRSTFINGKWVSEDDWNDSDEVIEWLRPVSGILLSVERYEALMKCVELLKYIAESDCTDPYSDVYIGSRVAALVDTSLQTLKQTNNE